MSFNSIVFILSFLPVSLLIYNISREKYRNVILLIISIIFYAWGSIETLYIVIISIVVNYFVGILINKNFKNKKKLFLVLGLVLNVAALLVFKCTGFFVSAASHGKISSNILISPLGISYFTFQQISYIVDIYKDKEKPLYNFLNFSLYILLFPKILSGPIEKYRELYPQIIERKLSLDKFYEGIYKFSIGLGKKVIIANNIQVVADKIFSTDPKIMGIKFAWLGMILYTLQIFFDFSGYSDMAIGIGKMFGFSLTENFNRPYISKSISEFWKRWHISLTRFLTEYVYISLGGNRISKRRTIINTFLVFLVSGLWHSFSFNVNITFVIWGAYHGILICLEKMGAIKILKKLPNYISQIWTFILVGIGWVIFRPGNGRTGSDIMYAAKYIKAMFTLSFAKGVSASYFKIDSKFYIVLIVALIISLIPDINIIKEKFATTFIVGKSVFSILILIYSIAVITTGSYMPFIYNKF